MILAYTFAKNTTQHACPRPSGRGVEAGGQGLNTGGRALRATYKDGCQDATMFTVRHK